MQNPTNGRPSNKIYINEHGYHALRECAACIIGRCDCIFLLRSEIRDGNTGLKVLWKCAKCTRDARSCLIGGVDVSLDKRREYGDASRRCEGTARGAGVTRARRIVADVPPRPGPQPPARIPTSAHLLRLERVYQDFGAIMQDVRSSIQPPIRPPIRLSVTPVRPDEPAPVKEEVDELDELESISDGR